MVVAVKQKKTDPGGTDLSPSFAESDLDEEAPVLPKVAAGNADAIAICMDRYGNLVWSLALKSCPDRAAAEDAVQDIFVQLWQLAGRYDASLASEATFVAMIARRRLIDLYRRRRDLTVPMEADWEIRDQTQNAAQSAELKDEALKAEAFLSELPPDQQRVIRLSIYDGLSHARIAETTGLSLGTVKTHIRRGLIELRSRLFPQTEASGGEATT